LQGATQAATMTASPAKPALKDLGPDGEEGVLAPNQRLLLTVGVRAGRSSVNGDPDKYFFFPQSAGSYRFVQPVGSVDELKLRAAWGQTGNPPLFGARFVLDSTNAIGGRVGQYHALRLGDTQITPERNNEIEAGLEAILGNQFATLGVTVYQ